jgi:hypothetical protein
LFAVNDNVNESKGDSSPKDWKQLLSKPPFLLHAPLPFMLYTIGLDLAAIIQRVTGACM